MTVSGSAVLDRGRPCPICGSVDLRDAFRVFPRGEYTRCRNCGLIFCKRVDPEKERAIFETDSSYSVGEPKRQELRAAVFEESLREIARLKKPGRILDVGCGNGQFLDLARRRGWEPSGVELSPLACAQAKEVYGLDVFRGELVEAGFPDSFFDVVTLLDALCLIPSPLEQLVEIRRILREDGLLVIRDRNALFHVNLVRFLRSLEPYLSFHVNCFTPKAIRRLLEKAGYREICVRNSAPTPRDPYSNFPLGDLVLHGIKIGVHSVTQVLSYLSAHTLILGPSLQVHAIKGGGAAKAAPV